jgi:hypothetical protein
MRRESLVDFFRKYHLKSDQEHASFVPHVFPHTAQTKIKNAKNGEVCSCRCGMEPDQSNPMCFVK